ncbi:transcriptional regulator [Achromobacter ruhlandii]
MNSVATGRVWLGIKAAGGASRVARAFEINRSSVYGWIRNGKVPADRCAKLVDMSGGAVTCEDLCDRFDWQGVRRLVEPVEQSLVGRIRPFTDLLDDSNFGQNEGTERRA